MLHLIVELGIDNTFIDKTFIDNTRDTGWLKSDFATGSLKSNESLFKYRTRSLIRSVVLISIIIRVLPILA
jgi:hypothetical protein